MTLATTVRQTIRFRQQKNVVHVRKKNTKGVNLKTKCLTYTGNVFLKKAYTFNKQKLYFSCKKLRGISKNKKHNICNKHVLTRSPWISKTDWGGYLICQNLTCQATDQTSVFDKLGWECFGWTRNCSKHRDAEWLLNYNVKQTGLFSLSAKVHVHSVH